MKSNRRQFLKISSPFLATLPFSLQAKWNNKSKKNTEAKPIVISTWAHGLPANEKAWEIISNGGTALDAVEKGVMVVESDPETRTVGIGGYPDREGHVTLDACIMDEHDNCGAVAFLEHIKNPIAVARLVMEKTPHVMLVGRGALQFALDQGFKKENLLTEASKKDWKNWLKKSEYKPVINIENHDTISMLALDSKGNLCGSCTTSGASWKMHGRVGDSPIIGAGLFLDNEVGGACATGLGEAVIRVAGSAAVVEMMRQGKSPQEACKAVVERIARKNKEVKDLQVGFLAMNKNGEYGAYSIQAGFNYAVCQEGNNKLKDAKSKF